MATVVVGLAVHGCVTLPLLLLLLGRRNPLRYTYNMLPAYLTAFGTSSSSATLPKTIECVEKSNKVHKAVAGFVLPLGATV